MLTVEHLFELGERLDKAEFKLAPHQFLSARYVLATLEARQLLPQHRYQLAPFLAPIFCTSAADQRRFPATFYAWLHDRFEDPVPRYEPDPIMERAPPVVPARWRLAWKPVFAMVGIVLAAVTTWAGYQNLRERTITGSLIGAGREEATVQIDGGPPTTLLDDGSFRLSTRALDLPVNVSVTAPRYLPHEQEVGEALARQRRWLFLRGENPDRFDLGRIELDPVPEEHKTVAIELPPVRSAAPAPINLLATLDLRSALPVPPLSKRVIWKDAAWTLSPLALFLVWQVWRATRRPVLQRLASRTPPLLREMHLPKGVGSIAPGLPMRRLVQELRRRRLMNSVELQVEQTIAATLRNAGVFTPVLGSRVEPDYLALIDSTCLSDHQARFCNELVGELARSDVLIERYSFDRTPSMCERRDAKRATAGRQNVASIALDELLARNPDHRVLLFTDGSGLFDPFTGTPAPCVATLLQWEAPYLLTAKPPRQWGELEFALENLGFKVLPLNREGMLLLMSMLAGAPATHLARERANVERGVPRYDRARRRWLERSPPDAAEIKRLCDALQADLCDPEEGFGDRGFAWLAGCAVYPEIHWGITLRVGAALVPDDAMREVLLPRLARLVWLRDAYMPDWMRQELLDRLSPEDEERIRAVMHDMLGMLSGEPGADVPLRIAMPATDSKSRWNAIVARLRSMLDGWWRRRRSEAVIRSAKPDSPLRDYVFLRFISGQSVGKLSLTAPGTLLKLLFRGGSPFLGFHPLLVLLTMLIATCALGVALGPLHTGRIFTPLVGIQFSADGTRMVVPFLTIRSAEGEDSLDNGEFVASGAALSTLRATAGRLEADNVILRTGDFMNTVAVSPDQSRLAFIDEKNETVAKTDLVLWDLTTGTEVGRRGVGSCSDVSSCVRFSADSSVLAFPSRSGGVDLWWLDARPAQRFKLFDTVSSLAFSPDGSLLAAASDGSRFEIAVWGVANATRAVTTFPIGEAVTRIDFSPDGRRLIVLLEGAVVVLDAATGARLVEAKIEAADYQTASIDPTGRLLARVHASDDFKEGGATLIDLQSGTHLDELRATETSAYAGASFSPDGRRLATAGFDGTLSLWELPANYPAPAAARSLALVVANQYPSRAIDPPDPVPFAASIATTLRERYGFGVTLLVNASRAQMLDALGQLTNLLRPADQLLIYFAGRARQSASGPIEFLGTESLDDWLTGGDLTDALYAMRAGQVLLVTGASEAGDSQPVPADEPHAPVGSREMIASLSRDPGVDFGRAFDAALKVARSAHSSEWVYAETQRRLKASKQPRPVAYSRIASVGDKPGNFRFTAPRNDAPAQTNAAPAPPPVQQTEPPPQSDARNERLEVSGDARREGDRYVLDFGQVRVGSGSRPLSIQITNAGDRPVTLSGNRGLASAFQVKDGCGGTTLSVKESCNAIVEFTVRTPGRFEENLDYSGEKQWRARFVFRGIAVADASGKPAAPEALQAK